MNAPAQLVPRFGVSTSQAYTLTQRITTIGREKINDIALPDSEISRRHARITEEAGVYTLEDLGSTNGTFVNGDRLAGIIRLHDGMTIDFGEKHRFTFVQAGTPDDATLLDPLGQNADPTMVDVFAAGVPAASPPPHDMQMGLATELEATPSIRPMELTDPAPLETELLRPVTAAPAPKRRGRLLLGIGCLGLFVIFLCAATFFFLDSYQDGRLLYCGPLQGLWEFLAGLVGQTVACP
ncbi:MAG: FHA domain-containing protein [Anaerolineales bacterium]|nr:FHA domain-containing protein [Anaerolineales bacterium]MCB0030863.1 FHA domain-containing protein [Anaerolineales bacterium]